MNGQTGIKDRYLDLFSKNIGTIMDNSSPFINSFREAAKLSFQRMGIPDKKNENYKYTDLAAFFDFDYKTSLMPGKSDIEEAENFQCGVTDLDTQGIILVNGYYPHTDKLKKLPKGMWVGSFKEATKQFCSIFEEHYGKYAATANDGLVHLNTAMATDGIFIYVPDNTVCEKPVQIVNIVQSSEDIFNQHRNLIVVGKNSEMTMIICDHTLSPSKFLTNAVTEVSVGENSRFNIIRVQNEHNNAGKITHTFINQHKNSFASSNNITLHGGMVRNNTYHYLVGEGAEARSNGLFLIDKFQHVDNYVSVDHFVPNCTSNQLFKGVIDEMSTGVFNGRIYVHPDAQKTAAFQRNNNILLTDDAKVFTKPHLEIYADDVKCSHGATVGQPDNDIMFYLRSRGIDQREAKLMLMFGFAHEVIQEIEVAALRDRLDSLVMQRLRGELSRCASCVVKCY